MCFTFISPASRVVKLGHEVIATRLRDVATYNTVVFITMATRTSVKYYLNLDLLGQDARVGSDAGLCFYDYEHDRLQQIRVFSP